MIDYVSSRPFHGDVEKAFALAAAALTGLGFRIRLRTAESVELLAPAQGGGGRNVLFGASFFRISHRGEALVIEADLAPLRNGARVLFWILTWLLLAWTGLASAVLYSKHSQLWWAPSPLAVVVILVVWRILGPLLARSMRDKTARGIDALLANMIAVGSG